MKLEQRVMDAFGPGLDLLGKEVKGYTDCNGKVWIDFTDGTEIRLEADSRGCVLMVWERSS